MPTAANLLLLQARDDTAAAFTSLGERLGRIKEIAEGTFAGMLAERAVETALDGVKDFVGGLVSSNAEVETLHTSLTALYGSATEATAALAYMNSFALNAPFKREDILTAGQAIASYGQDITAVLPALGNVAAVMGVQLPAATDALEAAMRGRFTQLARTLHVTQAELEQFGLKLTATGKVDTSTLLAAFEKLSAAKFSGGMAGQLNTMQGALTNLSNVFEMLQETVGEGLFKNLEGDLAGLVSWLKANRAEVTAFAAALGEGLGRAAALAGAAFGLIGNVIAVFANWFTGTALPVIETGVGYIAQWWQENSTAVAIALSTIWNRVKDFGNVLISGLREVWNYLQADAKFFWDALTQLFTLGGDAISGDWSTFGADFVAGTKLLASDAVNVFAALLTGIVDLITRIAYSVAEAMVPVANNLLGPISWVAVQFRTVFKEIGALIGDLVGVMAKAGTDIGNFLLKPFNLAIEAIKKANSELPEMFQSGAIQKMHGASLGNADQNAAGAQKAVTDFFDRNAPGLNAGQSYQATQSVAQAQAAMEANRKALVAPFDTFVADVAGKISGMLAPSATHSTKAKSDATTLGKEIVDNLFAAFGLKGGEIKGAPGAGGLPATNLMGDLTAPGTAVTSGGGAAAAGTSAAQRVTLGQLGASFMQTMATTGGLGGQGAAQARAQAAQDAIVAQGGQQVSIQQQMAATLEAARETLGRMEAALAKLLLPAAPAGNPARSAGVARPRVS